MDSGVCNVYVAEVMSGLFPRFSAARLHQKLHKRIEANLDRVGDEQIGSHGGRSKKQPYPSSIAYQP